MELTFNGTICVDECSSDVFTYQLASDFNCETTCSNLADSFYVELADGTDRKYRVCVASCPPDNDTHSSWIY